MSNHIIWHMTFEWYFYILFELFCFFLYGNAFDKNYQKCHCQGIHRYLLLQQIIYKHSYDAKKLWGYTYFVSLQLNLENMTVVVVQSWVLKFQTWDYWRMAIYSTIYLPKYFCCWQIYFSVITNVTPWLKNKISKMESLRQFEKEWSEDLAKYKH